MFDIVEFLNSYDIEIKKKKVKGMGNLSFFISELDACALEHHSTVSMFAYELTFLQHTLLITHIFCFDIVLIILSAP